MHVGHPCSSAAKRPKVDAPAGLVPGWLQKINTVASKKNSVAIPADDADDEETGEFDADDSAAALAAARAAKKTMVKITAAPNNVSSLPWFRYIPTDLPSGHRQRMFRHENRWRQF